MSRTPIDKVGLCVLREGRLLLARSRGNDVFQIPGGKVETGDTDDIAALEREIEEELGVRLNRDSLSYVGTFSAPAAGQSDRIVQVKLYEGGAPGEVAACSEIEELLWLDLGGATDRNLSAVVQDQIVPFLRARVV